MKAKEWLAKGREAKDPMTAFGSFWLAFNNVYFPLDGWPESKKVKRWLTANISEAAAQELLEKYINEINYLIRQPVIDMRENGRDTQGHVDAYSGSENPIDKLKSVFMIIYQIRCNLMHGQKSPSHDRDIELCANSCGILSEVIESGI